MSIIHCHDFNSFNLVWVNGVNPAAGANYAFGINAGYRYALASAHFVLTADANAANRLPRIGLSNALGILAESVVGVSLTASLAWHIDVQAGAVFSPVADPGNRHIMCGSGSHAVIVNAIQFFIAIDNIQATDQISAIQFCLRQWQSPELMVT
jgi:hypothetical protein